MFKHASAPLNNEAIWQARSAAALYLGGAVIGTITFLSPHPDEANIWAMFLVASVGYPVSALIYLFGHRTPKWSYHLLGFGGTLLITANVYLSGPTILSASTAYVYVWVPLWICAFFPLWQGLVHVFTTALCSLVALVLVQGDFALTVWSNIVGTTLIAALVVGSLTRKIHYLASTDVLTGAYNRREWELAVAHELARSKRYGFEISLVFMDLDWFKDINDQLGHATGDRVLMQLGDLAREHLRAEDTFARLGGDEFALLLPLCSPQDAINTVRRLSKGLSHGCTMSAGIATQTPDDTPDTIQARADQALYNAKEAGRNTCHLAVSNPTPMTAET